MPAGDVASPARALHEQALQMLRRGDVDAARPLLLRAAAMRDASGDVLADLALLEAREGRLEQAEALTGRVLRAASGHAKSLDVLGFVRLRQGSFAEAAQCFARILESVPRHPTARFNLARALLDANDLDAAGRAAEALLPARLDEALPDDARAMELLAAIRSRQSRFLEAIALLDRLAALTGRGQLAAVARNAFGLQHVCDWSQRNSLRARVLEGVRSSAPPVLHPFMLMADEGATGADMLQAARAIAGKTVPTAPTAAVTPGLGRREGRPRIGYLSPDFRDHAMMLLAAELFELHDRACVEVFGYADGPPDTSGMRARAARAMEHFVDLGAMDDDAAAKRIAADEVEVLIDLTGHGDDARPGILARRPAPVQASYLGYPASMGAAWIDYLIGDEVVTPASHAPLYAERLVRLPVCYQPRDRTQPRPGEAPSRAACRLPQDGFVFCAFGASYKITPDMFAIWMRLLREMPGSVLWLLRTNPFAFDHLRAEAGAAGMDPARLIEAETAPWREHVARLARADLYLDTQPCGAHTTAADALWAGVPVLTIEGPRFAARVAASLLRHAGLDALVADSAEAYFSRARLLATDAARLAQMRADIAAARLGGKLFDVPALVRALEAAYATMAQRARAALPPAAFAVPRRPVQQR